MSKHSERELTVEFVQEADATIVVVGRELSANLQRLRAATEEVLRSLQPGRVSGAINWGNLHCTDAQLVLDRYGDVWFQVVIEEADPSASELREYVQNELATRGWKNVSVLTEW